MKKRSFVQTSHAGISTVKQEMDTANLLTMDRANLPLTYEFTAPYQPYTVSSMGNDHDIFVPILYCTAHSTFKRTGKRNRNQQLLLSVSYYITPSLQYLPFRKDRPSLPSLYWPSPTPFINIFVKELANPSPSQTLFTHSHTNLIPSS